MLTVLVSAVLLHTVLGSNITTMSVAVPGLMSIGAGVAPAEALLFFIYIGVCSQFLLPFHHVILLLGEGKGYYSAKELLRLGIGHTFLMVAAALLLYLRGGACWDWPDGNLEGGRFCMPPGNSIEALMNHNILAAILDASSDGFTYTDETGLIVYNNRAYSELTGLPGRTDLRT